MESSKKKEPFRIAVIGAGIGGLAFAHAIEKAKLRGQFSNVHVKVYERRQDESTFQRYPIHIAPDGRSALSTVLSPPELEQLVERSNYGISHGGITLFTPSWGKLFGVRRYEGEQPQFVHRWILKEALEEGVEVIREKRFLGVHQDAAGKVVVEFDDGQEETADLVVGADGLGSSLRATLYPSHAQFERLPFIVVQMKLTPSASLANLPIDQHGINMVLGNQRYSVLLVPFKATSYDSSSEYIFLNTTMPAFPGWDNSEPAELLKRIIGLLRQDKANEALVQMLEEDVIPDSVGAWQIVTCDARHPVPFGGCGGRVVLIGDAAHAMPPQGGVGGSTALKDAQLLMEALCSTSELGDGHRPLSNALVAFHREMTTRSHGHMKDAKRRLYLSNREGWRVYTRNALLRLMNLFWPLANWVLNRGRESATKLNAKMTEGKKRA